MLSWFYVGIENGIMRNECLQKNNNGVKRKKCFEDFMKRKI